MINFALAAAVICTSASFICFLVVAFGAYYFVRDVYKYWTRPLNVFEE